MTIVLRIKFTGMPDMESVMQHIENNLRCKFNDFEDPLINGGSRFGKFEYITSCDWKEG